VVPIEEVDHWIDLPSQLMGHLTAVAHEIGRAQQAIWNPARVGLMIAGLEVPHVHLHVVPISGVHDLDFANADQSPDPAALDGAAARINEVLGRVEGRVA